MKLIQRINKRMKLIQRIKKRMKLIQRINKKMMKKRKRRTQSKHEVKLRRISR